MNLKRFRETINVQKLAKYNDEERVMLKSYLKMPTGKHGLEQFLIYSLITLLGKKSTIKCGVLAEGMCLDNLPILSESCHSIRRAVRSMEVMFLRIKKQGYWTIEYFDEEMLVKKEIFYLNRRRLKEIQPLVEKCRKH